jgi:hypothetical protein
VSSLALTQKLFAVSGFVNEMLVVAGGPGAAAVLALATLTRRVWRHAPDANASAAAAAD